MLGYQVCEARGDALERRSVLGNAAVIPGLAQIAHEQRFDWQIVGGGEELKRRHTDVRTAQAAKCDQQRPGIACHVELQRRVVRQIAGGTAPPSRLSLQGTCGESRPADGPRQRPAHRRPKPYIGAE